MEIVAATTKALVARYLAFIKSLYKGDASYVFTQKFNAKSLLKAETDFAKACFIKPVMAFDAGKIQAVATLFDAGQESLFVGLFEAEEGRERAVKMLIDEARKVAKERGKKQIIVGLNGHLSYGVGILEENFCKASFDSPYNKPYYKAYFEPYSSKTMSLCTYRSKISEAKEKLSPLLKLYQPKDQQDQPNNQRKHGKTAFGSAIMVREFEPKRFEEEAEIFRRLCDQTLIKTALYSETARGHFAQLMGGLKPFLRPENLLFAVDKGGSECGFLFWHPDYNSMLEAGRDHGLLSIYFRARSAHKKADTLKINAIGSCDGARATATLIAELTKKVTANYKFVETTFVWDSSEYSKQITTRILGTPYKKYSVYIIEP